MEIVIVDDGSYDEKTINCIKKWEKVRDVKVIRKENGGSFSARCIGIMCADGKYITFLDADDYYEKIDINRLIEKMEDDNIDILQLNYKKKYHVYTKLCESKCFNISIPPQRDIYITDICTNKMQYLSGNVWNKIYKGEILKEAIKEKKYIRMFMGDDAYLNLLVAFTGRVKTVSGMQTGFYVYCSGGGTSRLHPKRTIQDYSILKNAQQK